MPEAAAPEQPLIQQAVSDDLESLMALMHTANHYAVLKTGEPLWVNMPLARIHLNSNLEDNHFFVIKDGSGKIMAAIALNEEDPYMWDYEGTDGMALYIHKLMKDPENTPPHPGFTLIGFTAREALRRHKAFLRFDTKPGLTKLVNYYQNLGFTTKRASVYPSTGEEAVLMEAEPAVVLRRLAELS